MSFDLSLSKGDVIIGSDKDLKKVRKNTLLIQTCLKVIYTPIGSDPFYSTKGCTITQQDIGKGISPQFLERRVEASLKAALEYIQQVQTQQKKTQKVTPEELLKDIKYVSAEIDSVDPRQYNIQIVIETAALEEIQLPVFQLVSEQ